jgi:tetratricopeptide (TPR) repeat protein
VGRGVLRIRQGRIDEAIDDLRAAIALRPNQHHAYVNLAQAYQKQERLHEAVTLLDEAIRQEPSLAPLYRERARIHRQRGDTMAALRDLEQAIRLEPAGRQPWVLAVDYTERGKILQAEGNYEEAVESYDAALTTRPDHATVHARRAEALLRLAEADTDGGRQRARYEEAVRSLGLYLRLGRPEAAIYRARGLARAKLGDYGGAADDYTRALGIEPDAATQAARGWIYLVAFEAPVLALRDFEEAIRLEPDRGDPYNGRGNARLWLGRDPEAAVADAETALRLGPTEPRLLFNAARVFALAVGAIDVRSPDREPRAGTRARYQARALQLLHQALETGPPQQRASFWESIASDSALNPIRQCRGFVQLAAENTRPTD